MHRCCTAATVTVARHKQLQPKHALFEHEGASGSGRGRMQQMISCTEDLKRHQLLREQ